MISFSIHRPLILAFLFFTLSFFVQAADPLHYDGETHLANVKQLTFGGDNAEAYFDKDGKWVVYQSTRDSFQCDQIFIMDTERKNHHLVSTGHGATTCSFFIPGTDEVIFSSSHDQA